MPRQSGVSIQNNFSKGLITSANPLKFPENACSEVDNIYFNLDGSVEPRYGVNLEENGVPFTITDSLGAFNEYTWTNVNGDSNASFFVQQQGSILHFYDISSSTDVSVNKLNYTLDLSTFKSNTFSESPSLYACQFASGNGILFVVNPVCESFYITYDASTNTFSTNQLNIKVRDLTGVTEDAGLTNLSRPTTTRATCPTDYPRHWYNIMNQGWGYTNALTLWDTARTDLPSSCDFVGLYRKDPATSFDNTLVPSKSSLNVPAPKGHFILKAFNYDRNTALTDEGFTGVSIDGSLRALTPSSTWTDMTYGLRTWGGAMHYGYYNTNATDYYGFDFGSSTNVIRVKIPTLGLMSTGACTFTAKLYAKNSLPANSTDGTVLSTTKTWTYGVATTAVLDNLVFESTDKVTNFRYVWIAFTISVVNGSNNVFVYKKVKYAPDYMTVWSGTDAVSSPYYISTFRRPSCVAFYAGRAWFGGVNSPFASSKIYFSQIAQTLDQYEKCYQEADPTSEIFADLVSSDGGVIEIPEMGSLQRLWTHASGLLAFASNGVWIISGTGNGPFRADDYTIKRISSIGTYSPLSVIDFKTFPMWWAEDGIYSIQYDPKYDSYSSQPQSLGIISEFFDSIPLANRKYVKGAYDPIMQTAYWLFNSIVDGNVYEYNRVLCLNGYLQAFYPWTYSDNTYKIKGISYIQDAQHQIDPKIAYTVASSTQLSIAEHVTDVLDWGASFDVTPYFITAYKQEGKTQFFFQPGYVFVFMDELANSSCLVQAVYDYTTSPSEHKYSTLQECYNNISDNRSVRFRRLKIRGKGRCLQLKFIAHNDKPFRILGWSLDESANPGN